MGHCHSSGAWPAKPLRAARAARPWHRWGTHPATRPAPCSTRSSANTSRPSSPPRSTPLRTRALLGFARRRGITDGRSGTVTAIQRFGGGLQTNTHFHTLVLEGVFATAPDGTTRFDLAPPPTDREVARLLAAVGTRILRLLRRRGVLAADNAADLTTDPLADAPGTTARAT
ncbi:MAG: hypothetical protein B6D46_13700 [Polyangiaceae bacterium UTPRO1]|nr:MAG: hypothetical protein B6D46_13700 [Polyangiaceae bacterium UTPRO1]